MTVYVGQRRKGTAEVYVIERAGEISALPWRLDLDNHSPTGLEWGYGGSGPAQLALALLAHALGNDERALQLHQRFKFRVVGALARDGFVLPRSRVLAVIKQIEREMSKEATGVA